MRLISLLLILSFNALASDPLLKKQWAIKNSNQQIKKSVGENSRINLKAKKGFDINWVNLENTAKEEVIVAVIDSGVDINHPDLEGRISKDAWNFLDDNNNVVDDSGHGTHVAGIIAANANSIGIQGVANSKITILPIKALGKNVKDFSYRTASGKVKLLTTVYAQSINYAVEKGAKVINLSLGWPVVVQTDLVKKAVKNAIDEGVAIVAAAGNDSKNIVTFPCDFKGVLCVGATNIAGEIAPFSNFGAKVDLVAPGHEIYSLIPGKIKSRILRQKYYEIKDGTSQAAPFVSGIVASIFSLNPLMGLKELKARLLATTSKLSSNNTKNVLHGQVNMMDAIDIETPQYAYPVFKGMDSIEVKGLKFHQLIDIEQFNIKKITAKIKSLNSGVHFSKTSFDLDELNTQVPLSGFVNSLDVNSKLNFQIQLFNTQTKKLINTFNHEVTLVREISEEETFGQQFSIKEIDHRRVLRISQARKYTNIKPITDTRGLLSKPSFIFTDKNKKLPGKTALSFLTDKNGYKRTDVYLDFLAQVDKFFIEDIDRDGNADYILYGQRVDTKELFFAFYDKNLKPLWKKNIWNKKFNNDYDYLPEVSRTELDIQWINYLDSHYGKIKIPMFIGKSIYDKSDLDIEDESSNKLKEHIHRWIPQIKNNSVKLIQKIADSGGFYDDILDDNGYSTEVFYGVLDQADKDLTGSTFNALISVGEESSKDYFVVKFNAKGEYEITDFAKNYVELAGNKRKSIESLTNLTESKTLYRAFYVNLAQDKLRVVAPGLNSSKKQFKSNDWDDPILGGLLSTYKKDSTQFSIFKSLTGVYITKDNKVLDKAPINRERTFSGVEFAEMIQPLKVFSSKDQQYAPAFYKDSSFIKGNYTSITLLDEHKGKFIQPLKFSVKVKDNCIQKEPLKINELGRYAQMYICLSGSEVEFKFLPIEL